MPESAVETVGATAPSANGDSDPLGLETRPKTGPLAEPRDDVTGRSAGREDLLDAVALELRDVVRRDDASTEDDDVTGVDMIASVDDAVEASIARSADAAVAVIPEGPYVVPLSSAPAG